MDRIDQIERLLNEALDRPSSDRATFLDSKCAQDRLLRAEVESLLAAHEAADGFLDTPVVDAVDSLDVESPLPAGSRIGKYRVIKSIANGGMGTVYLAERDEIDFCQKVAVKLIRRGMMTAENLRRFHTERQMLARLEHPNITRLIDGGTTDNDQPYLVMEYVDGTDICDHCDSRGLGLAQRLGIFRQVCEAVHFAHRHLLIHRDIKPGNILVNPDGTPKLLDFGIAKLIGANSPTDDVTRTGFRAMTPRYASPEQAGGDAITTASDVYSLGMVLYELLTGRKPYSLDTASDLEIQRIICEQNPIPPSVVVVSENADHLSAAVDDKPATPESIARLRGERPEQISRRLRGDLDNIVLKALHKEPTRRYGTVQQLSTDLDNFLNGKPVLARKDTLIYRVTKLIKRNRFATAAIIAVFVSLLAGAISTTINLRRVQQEREVALDVAGFLGDVLSMANPYRTGRNANELLNMLAQAEQEVDADYDGEPASEAAVRFAIANTYAGLWRWPQAEVNVRRALAISTALYGPDSPQVADCLILLGRALTFQRKADRVEVQRRALSICRKLFKADDPRIAWARTCLAYALWAGGDPAELEEAGKLTSQALVVQRPLRSSIPMQLAISLHTTAYMNLVMRRYEDSARLFEEALDVYRDLPGREDRYMVECLHGYARSLRGLNRIEEEELVLQRYLHATPEDFQTEWFIREALWRLVTITQERLHTDWGDSPTRQVLLRRTEAALHKELEFHRQSGEESALRFDSLSEADLSVPDLAGIVLDFLDRHDPERSMEIARRCIPLAQSSLHLDDLSVSRQLVDRLRRTVKSDANLLSAVNKIFQEPPALTSHSENQSFPDQ